MTLHNIQEQLLGKEKNYCHILDNLHYQQGFVIKLKKELTGFPTLNIFDLSKMMNFVKTELDAKMYNKCEHALCPALLKLILYTNKIENWNTKLTNHCLFGANFGWGLTVHNSIGHASEID